MKLTRDRGCREKYKNIYKRESKNLKFLGHKSAVNVKILSFVKFTRVNSCFQ